MSGLARRFGLGRASGPRGGRERASASASDEQPSIAVAELPRQFERKATTLTLRNGDFRNGPVIVSQPDTLVLFAEDVHLDMPHPAIGESPFHLGHYAALIIVADRVVVDLRGHTMAMSAQMRARNRFMSLVDLNSAPLPPGLIGFTTEFVSPTDVTIRNGTLAESAHFCVHNAGGGRRLLLERLTFVGYEVGAVSISAVSDVTIRQCVVRQPARPTTSSFGAMCIDLHRECVAKGLKSSSRELARLMQSAPAAAPRHTDAICRCIVISNVFNVGLPPTDAAETGGGGGKRIRGVTVTDVKFAADVMAEPVEVIGISATHGGEPIKDMFGNLVSHADAEAGAFISRTQAAVSAGMDPAVRQRLMTGRPQHFHKVGGLDLRGHALRRKASLLVSVSGADGVTLRNLEGGRVRSSGPWAAAVGYAVNACRNVLLEGLKLRGVEASAPCTDSLSDERPQSGILVRHCVNVQLRRAAYSDTQACACVVRDAERTTIDACDFEAPVAVLRASGLQHRH